MSSTPTGQGVADDYFDINKFEQLLNRLEASKGRQQRQKSLEGRRDIFATGLGSMMSNFWCLLLLPDKVQATTILISISLRNFSIALRHPKVVNNVKNLLKVAVTSSLPALVVWWATSSKCKFPKNKTDSIRVLTWMASPDFLIVFGNQKIDKLKKLT